MTMVNDAPRSLHFDTDALPERDRFPAFCEEYIRGYTGLDFVKRDKSEFRGKIKLQRAGVVDVGYVETTPVDSLRSPSLVRDGDDSLLILLFQSGAAYQTQCKDDQKVEAGDAVIGDCGYPGEINVTRESRFWSLRVPRHRIMALLPHVGRFAGTRLERDPVARRLLFGYLSGTLTVDLNGGGRASHLFGEQIIDLVALATGAKGEAGEIAEQRGVRAVRLAAILRMIAQQFGNPGLSAAAIAAQLGITPRYVHLLLEATGCSFAQHLLDQRLEQAAALLRDPGRQGERITAIARQTGFADLSHFNRAFRRRFGDTPSGVRGTAFRNPYGE
jgi:AraC-like DNA-binding protein